ncbi:MAG: C25 family cysteine peptidase, partial [Candidatus Aegiribacteria sp.]
MIFFLVLAALTGGFMEVELHSFARSSNVSFDTLRVDGVTYQQVSAAGFTGSGDGTWAPGHPLLPSSSTTVLLPPDSRVDSLTISEEAWEQLPGKYLPFPRQSGLTGDTLFIPPDPGIYSAETVYPSTPISVTRQGSALGYSVATLTTTPVRYAPSDSTLMVLTSAEVGLHTAPSDMERMAPARETVWSGEMRRRGIMGLVSNPEDTSLYRSASVEELSAAGSPLSISSVPSHEGNCVDLLIITGAELEGAFTEVAEYRTRQGIVSTVRTVEWIDQNYSGCDSPERIRNFVRDAHVHWGVQAVILGGDDHIVPVRHCNGWAYNTYPFPTYQMPSDDYYGDIDGDWSAAGGLWSVDYQNSYLDLCVGRWPVDDPDDVNTMLQKVMIYEDPETVTQDFARRLLMMGSNDICGTGADDMIELMALLDSSFAVPRYLDEPTELYFPHDFPAGNLCRAEALQEFDAGYNLILHADHSETHKLATAGKNTLGQFMWDSDFATMGNDSMPSILWTLGCGPGHFDGAECFVEAGLVNSQFNGLVAAIANARYGLFNQKVTYFVFMDALFNTGYVHDQHGIYSPHWPLSYLGEAHRMSKNTDGISFVLLNLLGPPLLNVWRDDPVQLQLSVPSMVLVAGVSADIAVTVTNGSQPVAGVTVCLWKRDEIFRIGTTDSNGRATFTDVMAKYGGEGEALTVTAVKHRSELNIGTSTVASFLPDRKLINVLPAAVPVLSMESFAVEDEGDGQPNPGETVRLLPAAANSGGETASNVQAELRLVSGGQYIHSMPDPWCSFADIAAGSLEVAADPLVVQIAQGVESWSVAEFLVAFTCDGPEGTYRWTSPLYLTVRSDEYQLTVMDPRADNAGQNATVVLKDMLLVNSGLGEGRDLRVTVDNVFPPEIFLADTVTVPWLAAGSAISLEEDLVLNVFPDGSHSNWTTEGFPRCTFDVVVLSRGSSSVARTVDVGMVSLMQEEQPQSPVSLEVYETGQNEISLVWDQQGPPYPESFYAYIYDGVRGSRVFPLPVPVRQITVNGLSPGTEYQIGVTSIDSIGRESEPATINATTPRPAIEGWPLQLAGSAGGGPAVADVDADGMDEIVAATSFGKVYIIERNGARQTLSPPSGYDFDRFLGCAVGDVDGDSQLEIVVSCQKAIDVEGEERIGILLYDRAGFFWTAEEIAQTMANQQAASPAVGGTPVLLQADGGASLEIALRARGHFGTPPHLYLWRRDPSTGQWQDFGPQFPLSLIGSFYNSPTAVDFDGDGLEELLVTSFGTEGAGTSIKVVDFQEEAAVSITSHELTELDREGHVSRVYGTLAAAEENGDFYVAGAASTSQPASVVDILGPEPKVMTVERLIRELSRLIKRGYLVQEADIEPAFKLVDNDPSTRLDKIYQS